jgi:phthalate 4,5-dioxygenase reductase subunit
MSEAQNPELVLTLRVARASTIATDIREFELVAPAGDELPPFTSGAHILVQAPNGVTRRYSLCNPPAERTHYRIAVKREASGRGGSISIVDETSIGSDVHVSLPRNTFELDARVRNPLFIAGGIGITPILSMVRHLAAAEAPFRLYYLTRSAEATAFAQELREPTLRDNVVMHHDGGDPGQSFDLWPLLEKPRGHIYCCGPSALIEPVRDMTGHWSTSAVHFEDFAVREVPRKVDDQPFCVRVGLEGERIEVPAHASILEVLRAKGYRVPSSCESGTCGTCRTRVLAGEPDHRDLVLTDDERCREMTVCVSRAKTPELVIEL